MEKHYDHKAIEEKWYGIWESEGLFRSLPDDTRKPYTLVIPPPNVTGFLHMGHVLNNSIQDILARYHRMLGYNVCWVPGTDHAGIATQNMVEKKLREMGQDPSAMSREEFLGKVWEWKEKYGGIIIQQLRKLGSSCDWERTRFTMEPKLSRAVLQVFKGLYDKGLIYRGKYIVNWCPKLQTALSDDEVNRSEEASFLWKFKYPLADGSGHLVVATTRPETMLGDTGVAVNPEDERYQHLVGKKVRLPIVGREIPVFADSHVDKDFGTGCVKVTPSHDKNDFEMGITHGLDFLTVMDKQARMNQNVPEAFQGLDRFAAREAVVAKMEELGCYLGKEAHTVSVNRCYRTNDVIEPYLSEQWFIKMAPLAEKALAEVAEGRVTFYPERWVNTYNHWLTHIRDWCISRQLKWGHRIPIWYCGDCGKQTCSVESVQACEHCGSSRIEQDPDVLDTWASSWIWPFSVFDWPEETADLKYYYPTSTLVTAADIIFFWVARMIMSGVEFMGQAPFEKVYFNGIVRDLQGRKMSKTLGNSPDPLDIIESYGADALRFSIVYNTPYGEDTRFANESCDLGRGFCTKIWNANRFLQMSFEGVTADSNWRSERGDIVARWILSRLADTIQAVNEDLAQFRLAAAGSRIYNFVWGEFCDWYVEFLKPTIRAASEGEKAILLGRTRHVIDSFLRLLHPYMPFVTEELWQQLEPRESGCYLMAQTWPEFVQAERDHEADEAVATLQALITGSRAVRKSYGLPSSALFQLYLYGDDRRRAIFEAIGPILTKMAGLADYRFLEQDQAPSGCTALAVPGLSAYLDLRGHLDVESECAAIDKKLAKLEKEQLALEARLGSESFTAKAPEDVVAKVRAQLAELVRQSEGLKQTRADLETLK